MKINLITQIWLALNLLMGNIYPVQSQTNKNQIANKVEHYIKHLMQRQGIPGVNLAIIKNDHVIYRKSHGLANLEHQVPMQDSHIFRVYSLTKLTVVTALYQLIEQGKLSSEDPVSKFLFDLPQSWQNVQIKHLITHASGLPDMAPFMDFQELTESQATAVVFPQPLSNQPGQVYDYNQTNFWLLRRIIEKVSQSTLDDLIAHGQFNGEQQSVFFSGDSRTIVRNRVTPYFPFRTGQITIDHSYQQGKFLDAANGLNLTMQQFIDWDHRLKHNELLKLTTRNQMWQLFDYTDSEKQFAHGWDRHDINGHHSYGFTGSLVTAYRTYPAHKLSVIILSNGLEKYYNIDQAVNHLAGLVVDELADPLNETYESLLQTILSGSIKQFNTTLKQLHTTAKYQSINFESQVNAVGYSLLNLEHKQKAIQVLASNATQYPNSWNVYDSLAEAYERDQQYTAASSNYRKALKLSQQISADHTERLTKKITALQLKINQAVD